MSELRIVPIQTLGQNFIEPPYLPKGQDEYYLRNVAVGKPETHWRALTPDEIAILQADGNTCDDWKNIRVADPFTPSLIRGCRFFGLNRIGRINEVCLTHHDLQLPAGLTNSMIVSCDIGDDVAIHNVRYLAHTIVGNCSILFNIDEMNTTNHAKFGNGIVKDGEEEKVRVWMSLGNEAGGREVLPFDGMTAGDAYLWSRFRDDTDLMQRFAEITQSQFDPHRGYYSRIGDGCVIKDCRIIKDACFGPACYVKGANKLKNITINSSFDEPTQIGEGVELVNGIISRGCKVFYGCKAVRFVMAPHSNLKYGARLINSFLGDNSTVSCCEILNNLIFPAHEQHHNNSFLIASLVLGQSNIGAGATVGSNHNSRAPEGEILAGRGFWPGLCVSLKHNCRFASFTLLAKGAYPAELDIPLPFSLLSNDETAGRLVVLPAFWWMYNTYALMRNSWKFQARDKRQVKKQNIEFEFLAPDTTEELLAARRLLQIYIARAYLAQQGEDVSALSESQLAAKGLELLTDSRKQIAKLEIRADEMECSRRPVAILKAPAAWDAYGEMLLYYAVKNLLEWMEHNANASLTELSAALAGPRVNEWINVGGQLVPSGDLTELCDAIKSSRLNDWNAIHAAYDRLWDQYPIQKQKHAYAVLLECLGIDDLTPILWQNALDRAVAIQEGICQRTYDSRKKDYDNPYRQMTYRNSEEMRAVLGTIEDNGFVQQLREETEQFTQRINAIRSQ